MLTTLKILRFQANLPGGKIQKTDEELLEMIRNILDNKPIVCSGKDSMLYDILRDVHGGIKKKEEFNKRCG